MYKESSDVWFCSFLLLKNIPIASYKIIDRGKVKCVFDLSEEEWQTFKLQFANSEFVKLRNNFERIKDLCYALVGIVGTSFFVNYL